MNECRQKKHYKLRGKTYNRACKRRRDMKNYRLRGKPQNKKTMTILCDNIWFHRGWHAPYKMPGTISLIALALGYGVELKNILLRTTGRQTHYYK
jgi:hypothetical protein